MIGTLRINSRILLYIGTCFAIFMPINANLTQYNKKVIISTEIDSFILIIHTVNMEQNHTGSAKGKSIFEHAQIAQIQIRPAHAQSTIQAFDLLYYILKYPVILLKDSEGPDTTDPISVFACPRLLPRYIFTWHGPYNLGDMAA